MMIYLVSVLVMICTGVLDASEEQQQLDTAIQAYRQGEQAERIADRERAFNQALVLYTDLAKDHPNGRLLFNIGNCYYQLGRYPWAILFYYRAMKLVPREDKVSQNLALAMAKQGVDPSATPSVFDSVLFVHYRLSLAERFQLFSVLAIAAIALCSWWLGHPRRIIKVGATLSGLVTMTILASIVVTHYFSGVYAVVVESAKLHRDAGTHYALVQERPLLSGLKVEVLDVVDNGRWLRVVTPDGTMGYLSYDTARLI